MRCIHMKYEMHTYEINIKITSILLTFTYKKEYYTVQEYLNDSIDMHHIISLTKGNRTNSE